MTSPAAKILNFIGGKLAAAVSGQFIDDENPAIGSTYGQTPDSDEKDLDIAVVAAKRAFPTWRACPAEKRASMLDKLADLIERKSEDLPR